MAALEVRRAIKMARRLRMAFPSLPGFVMLVLRGMLTGWRGRHRLRRGWLLCPPAVPPGRHTVAERARGTPATSTAWRLGRLLTAASWPGPRLVRWWAPALWAPLPPPTPGLRSLVGAGRHAEQRGPTPLVGPQGRLSQPHPWCVGRRCERWRPPRAPRPTDGWSQTGPQPLRPAAGAWSGRAPGPGRPWRRQRSHIA
jgi:hypothetical protein